MFATELCVDLSGRCVLITGYSFDEIQRVTYQGVGMHKDVESVAGFEADTSLHKRSGKKNEQNDFDDQGCSASNELLVLPVLL
jgi:hypothetical protein